MSYDSGSKRLKILKGPNQALCMGDGQVDQVQGPRLSVPQLHRCLSWMTWSSQQKRTRSKKHGERENTFEQNSYLGEKKAGCKEESGTVTPQCLQYGCL